MASKAGPGHVGFVGPSPSDAEKMYLLHPDSNEVHPIRLKQEQK